MKRKPQQKETTTYPNIAALLSLTRKFSPLVDESELTLENAKFAAIDPEDEKLTRDQVFLILGMAKFELQAFLQEMDKLKLGYEEASKLVAAMHKAAMKRTVGPKRGVVEDVEFFRQQYDRMLDVLRGIAYNDQLSPGQAQHRAKAIFEAVTKDEKSLVDEKEHGKN